MKPIRHELSRMGWFLGLLLILGLLLPPAPVRADGFGEAAVRAAVETWVRYVTAEARPEAVVERMEPYRVGGQTVAYIAHLKDGGFCLGGADALVLPVYFYSPQGRYDPENPDYQFILREIGARQQQLQQGLAREDPTFQQYAEVLARRALFWQDLIAGRVPASPERQAAPAGMELGLTSQWHQDSPYNDQCPELPPSSGTHTIVGCTATATAQIMYYWKWPKTGVSSDSVIYNWRWRNTWDEEPLANDPHIPPNWAGGGRLEWTSANGGRLRMNGFWDQSVYGAALGLNSDNAYQTALTALWNRLIPASATFSANFGATTYNWNLMQDVHTDPPDAGDAEAARLSYQVAVAVDTAFGLFSSGSDLWRVEQPLENYFRYDTDAVYEPPDTTRMIEEIQWLRPIGFSGSDGVSGHGWVIYGYNTGTSPVQFKMNMGWGGSSGWYSLDKVPANLNLHQNHLTRIAPLNVVKFVGNSSSGDGSPDNPYRGIEEAITSAPTGATLIFKAGSDNTFSTGTLLIDRPFTLKGKNVTIRRQ